MSSLVYPSCKLSKICLALLSLILLQALTMAAFFSSSHLLLQFSFSPSLSFQNGSLKLRSNQFFPTNHSKFVNAFTAIGSSVAQLRTSATLRQLCEGHVPDHVLQRYVFTILFRSNTSILKISSISFFEF